MDVFKEEEYFVRKKFVFSQDKRNVEKQFYSHHSTIALQYFYFYLEQKRVDLFLMFRLT